MLRRYTAWTGGQLPFIDPTNSSRTRFYYSGGDGPHSGQRDDSIGLAYATTHAWAGLQYTGRPQDGGTVELITKEVPQPATGVMWLLADVAQDASVGVASAHSGVEADGAWDQVGEVGTTDGLRRVTLPVSALSRHVRFKFRILGEAVLYSFGFDSA